MTPPTRLERLQALEDDIRFAVYDYQVWREDLPDDPDEHLAADLDRTITTLVAITSLLEHLPARNYIPF